VVAISWWWIALAAWLTSGPALFVLILVVADVHVVGTQDPVDPPRWGPNPGERLTGNRDPLATTLRACLDGDDESG